MKREQKLQFLRVEKDRILKSLQEKEQKNASLDNNILEIIKKVSQFFKIHSFPKRLKRKCANKRKDVLI